MMKSHLAILAVGFGVLFGGPAARAEIYPISPDNFWISPQAVTFEQASAVIASYQGQDANLTTLNFLSVSDYVFLNLGPDARVWIHSWNGDTFGGAPLELVVGSTPGSAEVSIGSPEAVINVLVYNPQSIPEPGTLALGLVAAILFATGRWVSSGRWVC